MTFLVPSHRLLYSLKKDPNELKLFGQLTKLIGDMSMYSNWLLAIISSAFCGGTHKEVLGFSPLNEVPACYV